MHFFLYCWFLYACVYTSVWNEDLYIYPISNVKLIFGYRFQWNHFLYKFYSNNEYQQTNYLLLVHNSRTKMPFKYNKPNYWCHRKSKYAIFWPIFTTEICSLTTFYAVTHTNCHKYPCAFFPFLWNVYMCYWYMLYLPCFVFSCLYVDL